MFILALERTPPDSGWSILHDATLPKMIMGTWMVWPLFFGGPDLSEDQTGGVQLMYNHNGVMEWGALNGENPSDKPRPFHAPCPWIPIQRSEPERGVQTFLSHSAVRSFVTVGHTNRKTPASMVTCRNPCRGPP